MPRYSPIDRDVLLQRLELPSGPVSMVLDTDTYNEIDDQFAVVYALLSREKFDLEAWKNHTIIYLERIFGKDSSKIKMIKEIPIKKYLFVFPICLPGL